MELKNRKASFDYHFEDTEIAGIVLTGSEIKSLREGKASLVEGFIFIDDDNEMWLKKMYIAPYENGGYANHEPVRDRKLLMTKKQIQKWDKEVQTSNLTIIPVKGFFNKKGIFKLEIALAKGKKQYNKKESIKAKDIKRDLDRNL